MLDFREKNLWKSQHKIVVLNLIDLIGFYWSGFCHRTISMETVISRVFFVFENW